MENNNQVLQTGKKKANDFIKLIIGIVAVIIVLILLKYLAGALGVM